MYELLLYGKGRETAFGQFGQRSVRTGDWENESRRRGRRSTWNSYVANRTIHEDGVGRHVEFFLQVKRHRGERDTHVVCVYHMSRAQLAEGLCEQIVKT